MYTETVFTREETLELALESILRWVKRGYDTDFVYNLTLESIEKVAAVALESK